jgi:hypothetical protein
VLIGSLMLQLCGLWLGPAEAEKPLLAAVREVSPARLERPAMFWRNGKQVSTRDVLLIRVEVSSVVPFVPRGIAPPLFILGEWVCQFVRDPLAGKGQALLIAPRDAELVLWLTPSGPAPENLSEARTASYRKLAERSGNRLTVPVPSAEAPVKTYKDLGELTRQERPKS